MPESQLPSKIIEDIERKLEEIHRKVSAASDEIGLTRKIVSTGKEYWKSADQVMASGEPNEILTSGYQVLVSFSEQVNSLDEQSDEFLRDAQSLSGSGAVFADSTASTASISGYSLDFNSKPIKQFRYTFNSHEDYSNKMSVINPALGQVFKGIKSAYFGQPTEGLRQALSMTRQAFDQFFDALITDEEVIKQKWWIPEDPNKPKTVTRPQRIRYAAEKHIEDPARRKVLIDGVDHMNKVYKRLQVLHSREFLDEEKDKDALFEMLDILKNWVDSLKTA